jgi:hypothetical protein
VVKRAGVLVLIGAMTLGPVTPAVAGGSLLQSATRIAREAGRDMPLPAAAAARTAAARTATAEQGTLAESGMSRRKKLLIALVAFIGVAGGMYAIDHGVEDNTPSSKGTRKD